MTGHLPFSIRTEHAGAATRVIAVSGAIDMAGATEFEDALARAMDDDGATALLVDLTEVGFIDSTGLNALVRAFEHHRRLGNDFALVSDDRRVAIMLEISRLDRVLDRFATRDEALAALARRG